MFPAREGARCKIARLRSQLMKYIKPISFEETSCRTGAKELSEELEEGEQSGAYSSKIIILVVFNCKISILCILICRIHVNVVLGGGRWIPLPCKTIFARNNGTNLRTIYLDTRRCMAEMRGYYIRSSPRYVILANNKLSS